MDQQRGGGDKARVDWRPRAARSKVNFMRGETVAKLKKRVGREKKGKEIKC